MSTASSGVRLDILLPSASSQKRLDHSTRSCGGQSLVIMGVHFYNDRIGLSEVMDRPCVAWWLALALGLSSPAVAAEVPFGDGERLVYELSWYNLIGGTATMKVEETSRSGVPVFRIVSMAKSNSFVSMFFPVEDWIESVI